MEEKIIQTIKEHYSRDLRKQVVKTILKHEKDNDKEGLKSSYNVLNQVFTYIISELQWTLADNSNNWDETPLRIIKEAFPKLETTVWYKEQQLNIKNN